MNFLLTERKKCLYNLLPLVVSLLFLIYFSEVANAQEQDKVQNTSTVGDNQNQTIPGPLYENSSVYANPANVYFSSYENIELGIEIEYPSNWEIGEYEEPNSVYFRSLPEYEADRTRDYLRIDVIDRDFSSEKAIDGVNVTEPLQDLQFIELPHNATIFGNPGAKSMYTYTDSTHGEINVIKVAIESEDKIYVFNYFAQPSVFTDYLPSIKYIIGSLREISMVPYENFGIGMSIDYPSNWNKTDIEESYDNTVMFSPFDEINNASQLSNEIKIFSYFPVNEADASLNEQVDQIVNYRYGGVPDLNIISKQPFNLSSFASPASPYGLPLHAVGNKTANAIDLELTYTAPEIDKSVRERLILVMTNNRVYAILYYAEQEEFSRYLPILDKMIDSFQMFNVSRYEMPGINHSKMILRYPDTPPWEINEINASKIDFLQEQSLSNKFTLSVYPFSKNLTELAKEVRTEIDGEQNSNISEISNYTLNTNRDGNITGHKINFTYYNKPTNGVVKGIEVYANFSNTAFRVTYLSDPLSYGDYLSTAEQIIDSIKIVDPIENNNWISSPYVPFSEIIHPINWSLVLGQGVGFQIISPEDGPMDDFRETLSVTAAAAGTRPIEDFVSNNVNTIKESLTNFQTIDTQEGTLLNNTAHKMVYTYIDDVRDDGHGDIYNASSDEYIQYPCECVLQEIVSFTIIDQKLYMVTQTGELDKLASYVPTMEKIIESLKVGEKAVENITIKSGLPLNGGPVDLAVNPFTNRLYVAIPEARQIQVIEGSTDQVIQNITIDGKPNALALNPYMNKIYVTSPETDMVYVIDGLTNNVTAKIKAGPLVGDIAVDTTEFGGYSTLIFVANQGNGSISIIDEIQGKVVSNVKTGQNPFGVGIDSMRNRAYITFDFGVDVIDYTASSIDRTIRGSNIETIYAGYVPTGIVVDSNRSRAYMTNSASNTVSVIDTISNDELYNITVGLFPNSIAFNTANKKLYVSGTGDNIVSIIDIMSDKKVGEIEPDSIPYDVAVNPRTNMIYLANLESKTLSTIDGKTNNESSAVTFYINPPNAGYIECYENGTTKRIPENSYQRIIVGTSCKAIANNTGFAFSSWSNGAPSYNSTGIPVSNTPFDTLSGIITAVFGGSINKTNDSFNITQYGVYTANFSSPSQIIQVVSPFISIGGLVSVVLAAAVIPTFRVRKKANKEREEKSEKNMESMPILPRGYTTESIEKDEKEKHKQKDEAEEHSELLPKGEIIGVDTAIIAAVLVFVTLAEGFEVAELTQITVIAATVIFPFAISAIVGAANREKFATRLMIAGFINLMISVILIAIMKL